MLVVERDGEELALGPVQAESTGDYGVGESVVEAVVVTGEVTQEIGRSVGRLVTGDGGDVSSPVGIVQGSSEAVEQGTDTYLWVLGLISLSLALLNLLPLLPLDGGHIAFSLIEGLRGRAVAREVYERVSVVGIAVVLLLFFIGLSNDIDRLGE
jgi:regulator of sigma E protease